LYVYPVIVAVFDWSFNRRPPDRRIVLALILASIGVGLTLYPQPTTSVDPIGAVLVLASATGLSAYIILSERATRAAGARVGALGIVFGAGLSFALAGAMGGNLEWRSAAAQPALLLGLIIIGTVLPVTLFLAGVARVGPTGASLLSTLEPVFTVALGAVVLGESLIPIQWLGGGLILAAGLLVATRPTPAAEAAPTL
jgi:drug/metabolite transporter (DMT)-like permease